MKITSLRFIFISGTPKPSALGTNYMVNGTIGY